MDLDIGKLIATLGLDAREFRTALKQVETEMQKADRMVQQTSKTWNQKFQDMGRDLHTVGQQITMGVTLPLIGVGVGVFKMQKDFEKSMSMIVGLVGIAQEQVDQWHGSILEMAAALGKSPKELADALYYITSAGVKGAEAMQTLEMSAKASVSGLGETRVIADAVTSAINAYGKENITAAEATDVLVAAVREGKAEASGFAGSIGQVIPVASAMGVSFGEIAGVIAGMTRTGTGVETAAMQLKNILTTILKGGTKESEQLLGELGSSFEQLRKTVKEGGVLATLLELNRLTSLNADTMSLLFPNTRALTGVLDLLGANLEDNKKIIDAVVHSTGALNHAFETAANTSEFTYQQAVTAVKLALIEFGSAIKDTILPIMQGFIQRVREVTKWFSALDDAQKKNIIRWVSMAAAIGPVLIIMGKLLTLVSLVNPYITLAVAITGVVMKLTTWSKRTQEVVDTQQLLNDANKDAGKQFATQAAEVRKLVWMIENENLSNERRIDYINQLKQLLPGYNGEISKEGDLINHNTEAIDTYLGKLKEKIRMQIYEQKIAEIIRKQEEERIKLKESQIKKEEADYRLSQLRATGMERTSTVSGGFGLSGNLGVGTQAEMPTVLRQAEREAAKANKIVESSKSAILQYDAALKELEGTVKSVITTTASVPGGGGSGVGGGIGGGGGAGQVIKSILPITPEDLPGIEDAIQEYQRYWDEYESAQDAVHRRIKQRAKDKEFYKWLEEMNQGTEQATNQMEGLYNIVNGLESAFVGFFSHTQGGMKAMVQSFGNALQQMAAQLAAKATIFGILSLLGGGIGGKIGNFAAGLLGGKKLKEWIGFAQGGVVPPGYPNDTFPALLSSGETVTPPGQIPMKNIHVTVDGRIRGKDIALALRRL